MPRKGAYTPAIGAAMRARYEAGATGPELADAFGVSQTTAGNWLRAAGTEMRKPEPKGGWKRMEHLNGGPRKARRYLTTCPVCRRGIYEGDVAKRKPGHLGPVHEHCTP